MINPPIELREYQTKPDVLLTSEEMTTLKRLVGNKLSIQPGSGGGLYNLTASSYVGNIDLRTTSILIRPKVELDRVLFMLSYGMSPGRDYQGAIPRYPSRTWLSGKSRSSTETGHLGVTRGETDDRDQSYRIPRHVAGISGQRLVFLSPGIRIFRGWQN